MNIHKNARLTQLRREEMALSVIEGHLSKVRGAKDQVQTIAVLFLDSMACTFAAWRSFPRRRRLNPRAMVTSRCGVLLADTKNPRHQTASI